MTNKNDPKQVFLIIIVMIVLVFLFWIVSPAGKEPGVYVKVSDESLELLRLGRSPGEPFCMMCFDKYKVKLEILHKDGKKTDCERANLMIGNNFVYCDLGEVGMKKIKGQLLEVTNNTETLLDETEGDFNWES